MAKLNFQHRYSSLQCLIQCIILICRLVLKKDFFLLRSLLKQICLILR